MQKSTQNQMPPESQRILNDDKPTHHGNLAGLLEQADMVYVQQDYNVCEIVSMCQTRNFYRVYASVKNQGVTHIFNCQEISNCCERMCCSTPCRPFNMHVTCVNNTADPTDIGQKVCEFSRPCACTTCCFCRPQLICTLEQNNSTVGTVTEVCPCCFCGCIPIGSPLLKIGESSGQVRWTISGECCQCGFLCRKQCGACSDMNFSIHEGDTSDSGSIMGSILKKSTGCCNECFSDSDAYQIFFPPKATFGDKLMFIGNTIMLDYLYFEGYDCCQNVANFL